MSTEPTQRTRLFRGRLCPVVRSVRNVNTGAIYDLISYTRQVTNRRDGGWILRLWGANVGAVRRLAHM